MIVIIMLAFRQYSVDAIPIYTEYSSVNQQYSSYASLPAVSQFPSPTAFLFGYISYSSSTFHPQVIGRIPPASSSVPLLIAAWRSLSAMIDIRSFRIIFIRRIRRLQTLHTETNHTTRQYSAIYFSNIYTTPYHHTIPPTYHITYRDFST